MEAGGGGIANTSEGFKYRKDRVSGGNELGEKWQ